MIVVVLGAGQLAQMTYLAGVPLGMQVWAVDPVNMHVVHPVEKNVLPISVEQAFAQATAITAEFEHLSDDILKLADKTGKLFPSVEAIQTGGDRLKEKRLLDTLAVANCNYRLIETPAELENAFAEIGPALIVKTTKDGYDGYGQFRINDATSLRQVQSELAQHDFTRNPLIAEEKANFDRELSLVGARNAEGDIVCYPLAENHHYKGQLRVSLAPAPYVSDSVQQQAESAFKAIADALDYRGILAIEFFQLSETLLVNEIAPRVHNSGHWTMNGTPFSQFENHLRAVTGMPLGHADTTGVTAMINLIASEKHIADQVSALDGHLHWYGKEIRPKRKVGHLNVTAPNWQASAQQMQAIIGLGYDDDFPLLKDVAEKLIK